jgi:hypothetical protein
MNVQLDQLHLSIPNGFELEETKWILRTPAQQDLSDFRMIGRGKRPITVRPNLVIHRRMTELSNLDEHFAQVVSELMQSVAGMEELARAELQFDDGHKGKVAILAFSPAPGVRLCQFHAYRLDGGVLTSLTWTIDENDYNEDKQAECIDCIATAKYPQDMSRT